MWTQTGINYSQLLEHEKEIVRKINETIKKVNDELNQSLHFNTAISRLMECVNILSLYRNDVEDEKVLLNEVIWGYSLKKIVHLLSPFVPFITSEIREMWKADSDIFSVPFPIEDPAFLEKEAWVMIVQINGKKRSEITVRKEFSEKEIQELALSQDKIKSFLGEKEIRKIIICTSKNSEYCCLMEKFNNILKEALLAKASDIHIKEGQAVYFRQCSFLAKQEAMCSKEEILQFLNENGVIIEDEDKALDFSMAVIDGEQRVRGHFYKDKGGLSLALRFLPGEIPTLESINAPKVIKKYAEKSSGLILIAGKTGSGKTTTSASIIDHINRTESRHILTLEDPIEYEHPSKRGLVTQREIRGKGDVLQEALEAALRQDPDVVFVGEVKE